MKKIIYQIAFVAAILTATLTGCKKDKVPAIVPEKEKIYLPVKVVSTFLLNSASLVLTYYPTTNLIKSFSVGGEDNRTIRFIYNTDNKLVKAEYLYYDEQESKSYYDFILDEKGRPAKAYNYYYEYKAAAITKSPISIVFNYDEKDRVITAGHYDSSNPTGNPLNQYSYDTIGNISQIYNKTKLTPTKLTYDNKNGLFKNITNPVVISFLFGGFFQEHSLNNVINSDEYYQLSYQYEYNTDGYPIKGKSSTGIDYTYEYEVR